MLIARTIAISLALLISEASSAAPSGPQESLDSVCPRPALGDSVPEPPYTRSIAGVLATELVARNVGLGPEEPVQNYDYRFCLREHDDPRRQSPVLRVRPGDRVALQLTDRLSSQDGFPMPHVHDMRSCVPHQNLMEASIATVNLHFHGLNIPPTCSADDVLTTLVQPNDAPTGNISEFTYRFRIPSNEPPGLFWYHPHVHGTAQQ